MTKSDLIERVATRVPHISKKDTEVVVNTIFDSMTEALRRGSRIEIRGFGSFQVKIREAREGRNPKTGEEVRIPAKRTPFFKVGKELKERIDDAWRAERDGQGSASSPAQSGSAGGDAAIGSSGSTERP
jgi:integration host factor subunit beta